MQEALIYALCWACLWYVYGTATEPGEIGSTWNRFLWFLSRQGVQDWVLKPLGFCTRCAAFWWALAWLLWLHPWPYALAAFIAPVGVMVLAWVFEDND